MGEQRVESQGHYEMLWDCDHCGTKGLLGLSQRFCAECGAPQNPVKRYFPKEGEEKKVDGHVYEGADRQCPSCNTAMGAKAKNCTHCGAPMDGSAREVREVAAPVVAPPPKKKRWWIPVLIIGVILLIIFGIWFRFIRTKSAEVAVTKHTWSREIAIEEYKLVTESEWRNRVPSNAEGRTCIQKERSRKQVKTGREDCKTERRDKKDGTFESVKKCTPVMASEPVYDDWCTYSVRKWTQVDSAKTSGTGMSPVWSTASLPPETAPSTIGSRKQGKRTETLTIHFGDDDSCDVSDSVWRKYPDGKKAKVEVRASSGDVVCGSL
jgi:hypothetical protein